MVNAFLSTDSKYRPFYTRHPAFYGVSLIQIYLPLGKNDLDYHAITNLLRQGFLTDNLLLNVPFLDSFDYLINMAANPQQVKVIFRDKPPG